MTLRTYYVNAPKTPWPFGAPRTGNVPEVPGIKAQAREAFADLLGLLCRQRTPVSSAYLATTLRTPREVTLRRLATLCAAGLAVKHGEPGQNRIAYSITNDGREARKNYR